MDHKWIWLNIFLDHNHTMNSSCWCDSAVKSFICRKQKTGLMPFIFIVMNGAKRKFTDHHSNYKEIPTHTKEGKGKGRKEKTCLVFICIP